MGRTIEAETIHPFGVPRSTPWFQQCLHCSIISLLCVVSWTLLCVCVHFRLDIELSFIRSEYFYYLVVSVFLIVMYDCGMQVERDADLIHPKGILKQSKCQFAMLSWERLTLLFNTPHIILLYYLEQVHCTSVSSFTTSQITMVGPILSPKNEMSQTGIDLGPLVL